MRESVLAPNADAIPLIFPCSREVDLICVVNMADPGTARVSVDVHLDPRKLHSGLEIENELFIFARAGLPARIRDDLVFRTLSDHVLWAVLGIHLARC